MSTSLTFLVGTMLGIAVGSALVPLTQRELAGSVARAAAVDSDFAPREIAPPRVTRRQWVVLAVASGLLPAYVVHQVGWSPNALPPVLLLMGLIQLAYCDLTRRLLPKTLVYALSGVVVASGVLVALCTSEWDRLSMAVLGGLIAFAVFFAINLMNPRWMAFGDVRLSFVFGFGLAWVSPMALFQAFLYANLLALIVGVALIAVHRADRRSALPFGLYMASGAALVLLLWS
jgi:leader peptidase (prepilin peptidase) / N-methyltransferase